MDGVSLPQVGVIGLKRGSARRSRGTTPVLVKEKCKFIPLSCTKNDELLNKEQVVLVPYNEKLCCPELSPWLQLNLRAMSAKKLRKEQSNAPVDFNKDNHYTWLLKRRDRTKPLTVNFRYHQETESYIEEYRTFKSPGEAPVHTTLPLLPSQYPNIKSYTANIAKRVYLEPIPPIPKLTSTEEIWNKHKQKWDVLKSKYSHKQFVHINNAKGHTPLRVPIKIPKCESRTARSNQKSIFPVILSKFRSNSNAMSNHIV